MKLLLTSMVCALLIISLHSSTSGNASAADSVQTTIPIVLPNVPYGPPAVLEIAVNPVTNMIYVEDYWGVGMTNGNNVTAINGATNQVVANVGSFYVEDSGGLAVDSGTNQIFVNERWSISVIDGATYNTVKTINLPGGNGIGSVIAVNPATNIIYRTFDPSNGGGCCLEVINSTTGLVVNTLNTTGHIYKIGVNSRTNMIYLVGTTSSSEFFAVVNGSTGTFAQGLTKINDDSMMSLSAIDGSIAVNPSTNMVYFTGGEIDGSTNTFKSDNRFNITAGVDINPGTNALYVSDGQNKVNLYNATTGDLIQTIAVGYRPYFLAVDNATGSTYVANNGNNTVTVLSGSNAIPSTSSTTASTSSSVNPGSTTSLTGSSSSASSSTTLEITSTQNQTSAGNSTTTSNLNSGNSSGTFASSQGSNTGLTASNSATASNGSGNTGGATLTSSPSLIITAAMVVVVVSATIITTLFYRKRP